VIKIHLILGEAGAAEVETDAMVVAAAGVTTPAPAPVLFVMTNHRKSTTRTTTCFAVLSMKTGKFVLAVKPALVPNTSASWLQLLSEPAT
jgi:hypothetical protein